MNFIEEKLQKALASVNAKLAEQGQADFVPEVAAILGSGLGDFADECVKIVATVSYNDIEGFPVSTISGHKGQFVFGYVGDTKVVIMQGRVHYYEGYPMTDVVMPTRLMNLMGANKLLLTNAAGGCGDGFQPGDLMIINDHITSFVPSSLIGPNYGHNNAPRFPDMSEVYSKRMIAKIHELADKNGIKVQEVSTCRPPVPLTSLPQRFVHIRTSAHMLSACPPLVRLLLLTTSAWKSVVSPALPTCAPACPISPCPTRKSRRLLTVLLSSSRSWLATLS